MKTFDLHQDLSDAALYLNHQDFFKKNGLYDGWNEAGLPVNNQSDFPRLKLADVKALFASCCVLELRDGDVYRPTHPISETFKHIEYYYSLVNKKPKQIQIIKSKSDLENISKYELSFLLHIECASILEENLSFLDPLYDLGVRSIGLTWNFTNKFAGGAKESGGVTTLGKKLIKQMNDKGIILDLAHINEQSFFEAIKFSKKPPLYTHANCKELQNHPRNISDKQMKALAKAGGIFGLSGVPTFISSSPKVEDLANHIMHAVKIMGIDHVALGSDFNGMVSEKLTENFEEVQHIPNLIKALQQKGLSEQEIEKIMFKNIFNFLKKQIK